MLLSYLSLSKFKKNWGLGAEKTDLDLNRLTYKISAAFLNLT